MRFDHGAVLSQKRVSFGHVTVVALDILAEQVEEHLRLSAWIGSAGSSSFHVFSLTIIIPPYRHRVNWGLRVAPDGGKVGSMGRTPSTTADTVEKTAAVEPKKPARKRVAAPKPQPIFPSVSFLNRSHRP